MTAMTRELAALTTLLGAAEEALAAMQTLADSLVAINPAMAADLAPALEQLEDLAGRIEARRDEVATTTNP